MVEVAHEALFAEIGRIVREPTTSRTARLGLLEALGDMREAKAVALLIGHLGDEDPEVSTVARRALIAITRQDYASDTRKWLAWWGQNSSRHRIEWLIDALSDETPGIRRAAGEELKTLTQETFGYYDDLPKRERERAQQRFRDWWASEGRARFVRS
jgi:HEAT repeat protein